MPSERQAGGAGEVWRQERRRWVRAEIEGLVKARGLDRGRFSEYPKTGYSAVIRRFYYAFADHVRYPKVSLDRCWLKLREGLKGLGQVSELDLDWAGFLRALWALTPWREEERLYLLLSEGWVYEGCGREVFTVLWELDGVWEDFYVVSKGFDQMALYCADGGYGAMYQK